MTSLKGRRRGAAVVLAGVLAALALAAVWVAMAAAAPRLGFIHIRSNLSGTETLISAYPDLAMSPDGDRVAVAWTEEYVEGFGKGYGHVYLRAASESGGGWGSKITVFSGGATSYALDASVAVTGTVAHVVYVVRGSSYYYVYHKECNLTQGTCGNAKQITNASVASNKITWVDVAVDGDGNPHAVWAQYDASGQNGEIWYSAYGGSSWGSKVDVHTGGDDSAPAIAWANGYAHVVWKDETSDGRIWYKRRDATGTWGGLIPIYTAVSNEQPYKPDVAAWEDRVFVVWDWCNDYLPANPPCDRFSLSYHRSNDTGASWAASSRDVGTDSPSSSEMYESTDDKNAVDEYLLALRPSLALNADGWPAVVWHVGGSGEDDLYQIYYTYAITGTGSGISWTVAPTTVLNLDQSRHRGSAAVGAASSGADTLLHFAYMREASTAWDVYYDSNQDPSIYKFVYLPLIFRGY